MRRAPTALLATALGLLLSGAPLHGPRTTAPALARPAPAPQVAVTPAAAVPPPAAPAAPTLLGEIDATPSSQGASTLPAELIARVRAESPDVLVVLGAQVHHGQPGRHLRQRLAAALQLYTVLDRRPALVLSGGRGEAQAMRDYLLANGVPRAQMFLETRSRSTVQNARFSMAILRRHPERFHSALLVTTAIRRRRGRIDDHALRALHDFAPYCRNLRVCAVNINVGPRIEPRVYVATSARQRTRHRHRS